MKRPKWDANKVKLYIEKQKSGVASSQIVSHFGMSRQTAARVLGQLLEADKILKTGSTQSALYYPSSAKNQVRQPSLKLNKSLRSLAEDKVFDEVTLKIQLQRRLPDRTFRIAGYAFCEMLNNAIDHSQSPQAAIVVSLDKGAFSFTIRDFGIGVFKRIQTGFGLQSEFDAIEHLLKGKQTTAPEAHSGQGIFFTSKIADIFSLRSGKLLLKFDNANADISVGEERSLKGTEVFFKIKQQTRKNLSDLFAQYASEDFAFDTTKYPIVVLKQTGVISRSQARRLTTGLETYSRVILDFADVKELTQGFADEIFRVFQRKNPNLIFEVRNANLAVNFMIQRAIRSGEER